MDRTTPWMPRTMRPVRKGVYETREPAGEVWFNYYDGHGWHYGTCDISFYDSPESFMWDQPMGVKDEFRFVKSWRGLKRRAISRGADKE